MSKKKVITLDPVMEQETPATVEVTTEASTPAPKKSKKAAPSFSADLDAVVAAPAKKKVGLPKAESATESKAHTKYDVVINGTTIVTDASKIQLAHALVSHALKQGKAISELNASKFVASFPLLVEYPENTTKEHIASDLGKNRVRYATKEDKLISHNKSVFVLCNQWYPKNADKLIEALSNEYPEIFVTAK